jgi:hypothetical protein
MSYFFDTRAIVAAAAKHSPEPRLLCGKANRGKFQCTLEPDQMGWLHVAKIKYGPSIRDLTRVEKIDIPMEEYIQRRGMFFMFSGSAPFGSIALDSTWLDIFYQMEFRDGRKSDTIRCRLAQ